MVEAIEAVLPQGEARERMSDEEIAACIRENEHRIVAHLGGEDPREGEFVPYGEPL